MKSNSLICETCKDSYNTDKKKPIYLPCSHTFCKLCLADNLKKNTYIKCPIDNKKHFQMLDQYTTNQMILRQLNYETDKSKMKIPRSNSNIYIKLDSKKLENENDKSRVFKLDTIDGVSKSFIDTEEDIDNRKMFEKDTLKICFETDYTINGDFVDEEELADIVDDKVFEQKEINTKDENNLRSNIDWLDMNKTNQLSDVEDNVIFSYINVMKNIVSTYEKLMYPQKKPMSKMDKLEEKEKDNHKEVYDNIAKVVKFFLIVIVIIFNYYIIKNQLFLRIFAFVALSNDTKKSLVSQNVNSLTLCLKRW